MEKEKITYRYVDTGHWLARCDHSTNVIEINKREYFKLSPYLKEYIWIHEHVHLLCDEYDENKCNLITDRIFLNRSNDEKDRGKRLRFLMNSSDMSDKISHEAVAIVTAIVGAVVAVTSAAWGIGSAVSARRNGGYYSFSETERKILVDNLLDEAYKESLLTDRYSAKDIFWTKLSPYISRKNEKTFEGWIENNFFAWSLIGKYTDKYGIDFYAITPIQKEKHPDYIASRNKLLGISAIAVALLVLLVFLIKTSKK